MGLTRWLARKGAVGGTARWAANGYEFFRQRHPAANKVGDNDIFRLMIAHRYPDEGPDMEVLLRLADSAKGLEGLVVGVLSVEAGFTENDYSVQQIFVEVITEELERRAIPRDVIYGRTASAADGAHVFNKHGLCAQCGWSRDAVRRLGQDTCESG